MRTFIAIELPAEVKETLFKIEEQLKESGADVKWIAKENIHLTLKFLGERDEKKIKAIAWLLEEFSQGKHALTASLGNIGAFPQINSPRVIWAGVEKAKESIKAIADELEERISKLGIPKEERQFSAHITIGRVKSRFMRRELSKHLDYLSGKTIPCPEFLLQKIILFKSTLTSCGALYEALKEVNLSAA